MHIAIISDIHDNIPNLTKVLTYCNANEIEKIICCGDVGTIETLDVLNENFQGDIFFSFGNMDKGHVATYPFSGDTYKHTAIFENYGEVHIDGYAVAFAHFPDVAEQLSVIGKYDYVFYGHTHMPWEKRIQNTVMLNPGNVANQRYAPTFAVWDTDTNLFKLIQINSL